MDICGFKIYYTGKKEVIGTDEDIHKQWQEAPDENVQVVGFFFKKTDGQGWPTRRIMQGSDYYALDADGTITQSFNDRNAVQGHVKYGRYTDMAELEEILSTAFADYGDRWLN